MKLPQPDPGSRSGAGLRPAGQEVDDLGGERGDAAGAQIPVHVVGGALVEHPPQLFLRGPADSAAGRGAEAQDPVEVRVGTPRITGPDRHDHEGGADPRGDGHLKQERQFVRYVGQQPGETGEHGPRLLPGEHHHAADEPPVGMEPDTHRGHHTEVPAPAAQRPEQFGLVPRRDEPAVGERDLGFEQVVGREPGRAEQRAVAAPERETGHADGADGARGDVHPVRCRRGYHVTGPASPADDGRVPFDPYVTHRAEVDHQLAAQRPPRPVVASAAHGHPRAGGPCRADRGGGLRTGARPDHQGRPSGHRAVPQRRRRGVLRVARAEELIGPQALVQPTVQFIDHVRRTHGLPQV